MPAPRLLRRPLAFRDRFRPWVIKRTVLNTYEGTPRQNQRKLCFFASYSEESILSPYLLAYLKELQHCGFDIVFCTTSEFLNKEQVNTLTQYCHQVIHRQNIGHDFASWKACFALFPDWKTAGSLLITNDSILGPVSPLGPLFKALDESSVPSWGLSDSYERAYHLQSFFIYLKTEALQSRKLRRFWAGVSLLTEKYDIVKFYELGLTKVLINDDIECQAVFSSEKVMEYCRSLGKSYQYPEYLSRATFNAALHAPYELVTQLGYPFVKADLIRNDRYKCQFLPELQQLLESKQCRPSRDFSSMLDGSSELIAV